MSLVTSYGEVFAERRKVRRMKMQEFGRIGLTPSYIHGVEKKGMLPSPEKRDAIGTFMGSVATQQDADPIEEHLILRQAWWETKLEQLEVNPDIVPAVARLLAANEEQQTVGARAIEETFTSQPE